MSVTSTPVGYVALVVFGEDPQPGLGGGGGDEFDDDLVGGERLAPPALGDESEHAVLNAYLHRGV